VIALLSDLFNFWTDYQALAYNKAEVKGVILTDVIEMGKLGTFRYGV
jgi:hypothetical protein